MTMETLWDTNSCIGTSLDSLPKTVVGMRHENNCRGASLDSFPKVSEKGKINNLSPHYVLRLAMNAWCL